MPAHRTLVLATAALALSACNPFRRSPAVEVNQGDTNLYTRWHGTVTSPPSLSGVVQMRGTATMAPGSDARTTHRLPTRHRPHRRTEEPRQARRGHGCAGPRVGTFVAIEGLGSRTA